MVSPAEGLGQLTEEFGSATELAACSLLAEAIRESCHLCVPNCPRCPRSPYCSVHTWEMSLGRNIGPFPTLFLCVFVLFFFLLWIAFILKRKNTGLWVGGGGL